MRSPTSNPASTRSPWQQLVSRRRWCATSMCFVDQTVRVDVQLDLGDVATEVDVQATFPVVQSETSSIGSVVDGKQINSLPLNGRTEHSGSDDSGARSAEGDDQSNGCGWRVVWRSQHDRRWRREHRRGQRKNPASRTFFGIDRRVQGHREWGVGGIWSRRVSSRRRQQIRHKRISRKPVRFQSQSGAVVKARVCDSPSQAAVQQK